MAPSLAQQGAFDWMVQQHDPGSRTEHLEVAERSGTPPAKGGGAARSAVRSKPRGGNRPPRAPAPTPVPLPPDEELWDVHAAARFLKRSVSWVYHQAEAGVLPVRRLGGWGVRFIPAELRAWVEAGGGVAATRGAAKR